MEIDIGKVVGGGYGDFWQYKGRYRVIKGGRGAKKSSTVALWYIYHMMKIPDANLLVVRRYNNSHKHSTFAQLTWAIKKLGVESLWQEKKCPLGLTYLPTGQQIFFKGLDNPESLLSMTVDKGVLCWVWLEEAFQIQSEEVFNKIDLSLRGQMPKNCFKQLTLTFNPWSEGHWLKKRFFDEEKDNVLAVTKTYLDNEFLDAADIAAFEELKRCFPDRYKVEGLGEWGVAHGLIYTNWEVKAFDPMELLRKDKSLQLLCGLDFGFAADPTAFIAFLADKKGHELYVFDEFYEKALVNREIAAKISYRGFGKSLIIADSAEPKSIRELREAGLYRLKGAKKGPDSLRHGIRELQGYHITVHPKCVNTKRELASYIWQDGSDSPCDENNHLMDALRYGLDGLGQGISVFK